jgi:NDP-sugar pyrophosphorylase family protein
VNRTTGDSALAEIPVAILAGGLATRLRPITEKIPKALVQVAGRPFLAHQLELLRMHGVRRIVLCVGYLGEMIEQAFGDGSQLDLRIDYSYDGEPSFSCSTAIPICRSITLPSRSHSALAGSRR